jgi:hypothetical protein
MLVPAQVCEYADLWHPIRCTFVVACVLHEKSSRRATLADSQMKN